MIRPPVKWHGGKFYMKKHIIDLMPAHHTYVECYGGAASVLLNKVASPIEVYNDINWDIYNLFKVLRDPVTALRLQISLELTPYSENEWDEALKMCGQDNLAEADGIEQSRLFFLKSRQSMGGRGDAFSYSTKRVRANLPDVVSGYLSAIDVELPKIVQRLREVQIMNRPALELIDKFDGSDTLFYLDPPYLPETRKSKEVYTNEMTFEQHEELAVRLQRVEGKVIVSGYPSDSYNEWYKTWNKKTIDIANHSSKADTKERKSETLWFNFWSDGTEMLRNVGDCE